MNLDGVVLPCVGDCLLGIDVFVCKRDRFDKQTGMAELVEPPSPVLEDCGI